MRFQIEIGATAAAAAVQDDGSHVCDLTFDNIWMVSKRKAGRREGIEKGSRGKDPQHLAYNLHFFLYFFLFVFLFFLRLLLISKSLWGLPGFDVCQSYVRVKILSNLISINPPLKGLLPNLINVANWFRLVMRSLGYILYGQREREQIVNPKLAKRALQINVCSGFVSLPTY